MKNRNILYISFDGLLDPLGQSQIVPYVDHISKFGNLTLISLEKYFRVRSLKKINKSFDWVYFYFTKKYKLISKFYDFTKILIYSIYICKKKNIDIVHCRGHLPAIIAFVLKKIYGIKFIFDFRGFWIDERVDNGSINKNLFLDNFLYKILKKLEKILLNNSDAFIFLTQFAANEIKKRVKKKLLFKIIPCATDYNFFKEENRKKNEFSKKKYLCYLGSLGGVYLLDEMLNFYYYLNKFDNRYRFLFITNNPEILKKNFFYCNNKLFKKNIVIRNLHRKQIPNFLQSCDYAISFIRPTWARKSSFPTKIAEFLSMNLPIIYNYGLNGVDNFFNKNKLGKGIKLKKKYSNRDVRDILKNLKNLKTNNKLRSISRNLLSLEVANKSYSQIYEKI
jgi:hypothetical protein